MKPALVSRLIVATALLLFFALAVSTALDKSPTNDEPVHLTRGAALHQDRDFSLQFEHTPLSHWLIGALFATEPDLPRVRELPSKATGDRLDIAAEFLWQRGVDVDRLTFLGRMPVIWTGLLLGAVLALWVAAVASRAANALPTDPRAAVAALAIVMTLYAVSSNLIAAAALATTDFVATAATFAAVCAWWFFWQQPDWRRWLATGLLLGLALAAKLTGVLIVPVMLALAYVYPRSRASGRPALLWAGLLPVAGAVVWASYAFTIGPFGAVTVPAPAYWQSWASVLTHVGEGHQAFFMGQLSSAGWWLYFPVAFLLKTPVIWLALIAVAFVLVAQRRASWRVAAFTLLPAAAVFAAAIVSRLNIGYRHILPAVPFLLVLIGHTLPALWARPAARWLVSAGVALTALVALWIHPHHLAAFNLLAGGPERGYRYLGDSNLDWGQDLRALAEWVAAADGPVAYSYAGSADRVYYGLTAPPLTGPDGVLPGFSPANPAPGRYAISATHIQGVLDDADLFDWFRRRAPDGSLGYSILLYDVAAAQPGVWIAHCTNPGPALTPAQAEQLVGAAGARHITVDCAQTEVWPGGDAPGWTIAPGLATGSDVVYNHRATNQAPDFTVRYAAEPSAQAALRTSALTARGQQATLPITFNDSARLAGYQTNGREWLTVWEVLDTPDAPLSIQAHLLSADGALLGVADGLGYASDQWQAGDRFSQRFDFGDTPAGAFLETGLYNYVTLEPLGEPVRLPVADEAGE